MGEEIPVAYIVNNVTATLSHSGTCMRDYPNVPEKHLPSQTMYNEGEKKSFSETSRLLFSSLEHKIVHDKDIMILEFNAFLENVTMLLSECFRVRVFLFTYISAKCNYGFQKRKQQLGYSM